MSLEKLKSDFPVFLVKNMHSVPKIIFTLEGDVQVQPYATAKIESQLLHQIPDNSVFKMVSPTVADLIKYGIIKPKTTAAATPVVSAKSDQSDK